MPEKMPEAEKKFVAPDVEPQEMDENEKAFYKWIFENGEKPEFLNESSSETEQAPEDALKLKDKYLGIEMPEEEKGEMESILDKDAENAKLEYVKEWIKDNKGDLEKEHPEIKTKSEEELISFALTGLDPEKSPLDQLDKDEKIQKKYSPNLEKIENLFVLSEGLKKKHPTPEIQFLALNHFYENAKKASIEFHKKENDPNSAPEEIERAKKEWLRQSDIVRDLAEKITGKDPKLQAEEETNAPALKEKKEFINSKLQRFEEIKSRRYGEILGSLSEEDLKKSGMVDAQGRAVKIDISKDFRLDSKAGELSRDQVLAIAGIYGAKELKNIRHKFLSNKIIIGGKEIESGKLDAFLADKKKELDDKIMKDLEDAAELQWKRKTRADVAKKFDAIIKEIASPEKAKELIEGKYKALKEKLASQWEEEERKQEKKKAAVKAEKEPDAEAKKELDSLQKILALKESPDPESAMKYFLNNLDEISGHLKNLGIDEKIISKGLKEIANDPKNTKKMRNFLGGVVQVIVSTAV